MFNATITTLVFELYCIVVDGCDGRFYYVVGSVKLYCLVGSGRFRWKPVESCNVASSGTYLLKK